MTRTPLFALALVTASTGLAAAEDSPQKVAAQALAAFASETSRLAHSPAPAENYTIEGCTKAIQAARAAGVADNAKLPWYSSLGDNFTLARAPALCEAFAKAHRFAEAYKVVMDAQSSLEWLAEIDYEANHEGNQPMLEKSAATCTSELARLIKEGVDTDAVLHFRDLDVKIGEAQTKVCAPLAKAAATFAKDVAAAKEKVLAPYKAAGIKGDRLDFVKDNDGSIRGVGGRSLTTMKEIKSAKLMFVVTVDSNEIYSVTRYVFSGNKMVTWTTKKYDREPGAGAFR